MRRPGLAEQSVDWAPSSANYPSGTSLSSRARVILPWSGPIPWSGTIQMAGEAAASAAQTGEWRGSFGLPVVASEGNFHASDGA